jgi:hypothetical protein
MREQMPKEQVVYVQQLVNVLALPITGLDNAEEQYYSEEHRSVGAMEQDVLIPHVEKWLSNRDYKPKGFADKRLVRLQKFVNRFLLYKGRLYRRGTESQHRLYVPKTRRTYMMTAAHDYNGHCDKIFVGTEILVARDGARH